MGPLNLLIPGLPEDLRTVPAWFHTDGAFDHLHPSWRHRLVEGATLVDDRPATDLLTWFDGGPHDWRTDWRRWRQALIAYRDEVDRATDPTSRHNLFPAEAVTAQRHELALCAQSCAYFLAVYGWIFEPRDHVDPDFPDPGWRPWALMPHQVWLLDEIEDAIRYPAPRGNLVVEKSRDMGATWTFCGWTTWKWLFARDFTAGLMSYREAEAVEDHPDSLMFKISAILGIERAPGLPEWMFPVEFWTNQRDLDHKKTLEHPTRTNFLRAEATTEIAGSGNRAFVRMNDEAAKFKIGLKHVLTSTASVTQHSFTLSSAFSKYNDDFQRYADHCRDAKPGDLLPKLISLTYHLQPFHDAAWLEQTRAAYDSHHDREGFEREVLIDYRAGAGRWIYEQDVRNRPIVPDLVFDPNLVTWVSIDPGGTDDCAIGVFQTKPDPHWDHSNLTHWADIFVLDSYSHNLEGAAYYAHLLTGLPPEPGDECYGKLVDGRTVDFMRFMRELSWTRGKTWWCGDPAGEAKEQATRQSFYKLLALSSLRLRKRWLTRQENAAPAESARPIVVISSDISRFRDFQSRRLAARPVIARTHFAGTQGALAVREALCNARFLDPTPKMTTDPATAHDEWSHLVSMFEYFAQYQRLGLGKTVDQTQREKKEAAWLPPAGITFPGYRRRTA